MAEVFGRSYFRKRHQIQSRVQLQCAAVHVVQLGKSGPGKFFVRVLDQASPALGEANTLLW